MNTNEQEQAPSFLRNELANSVTHGIGFFLSVAALTLLVVFSALRGTAIHIVACSIYGTTLTILYLASTLYHSVTHPASKRVLRVIDHASIYLLIAGTYTPITLVTLSGARGWTVFGLVWGLALAGIAFKVFFTGRMKLLSSGIYLGMGWMALFIVKPLLKQAPAGLVWWLAAGGLVYSLGVIFYSFKRIPHHHAIWHLFVIGGSVCHFFAVMLYVLPPAS